MSSHEDQEKMRLARTSGVYNDIWQNTGKCVFCDLKEKYILHEENGIVLTINLFPYIDGQMMAIPRRHVKSTNELTQIEWETMRKFGYIAKKLFKKIHKCKAMWSLVKTGLEAQGTVADHLHMHFIPFDAQDLCVWNYRELKYTPLQNIAIYEKAVNDFVESYNKFEQKYTNKSELPIVCDLIIINKDRKILFQERKKEYKHYPDNLTFPGGHITDFSKSLIKGLQHEIEEELNYKFDEKDIEIVSTSISRLNNIITLTKFRKKVLKPSVFLWNTYVLKSFDENQILKPGDDCDNIIWLSEKELQSSDRVVKEMKETAKKALQLFK